MEVFIERTSKQDQKIAQAAIGKCNSTYQKLKTDGNIVQIKIRATAAL